MIDFSKALEWLKISGKQAFILCILSSILLFGSDSLISKLGLLDAREYLKTWVGVVWLLSISILITNMLHPVFSWIGQRIQWRANLRRYQRQLNNLTQDEKEFLYVYIAEDIRTQYAEYSNGTVNGLEAAKIIYRSSNLSHHYQTFPYNIQPWALEYLKKHPECLA